MLDLRNLVVGLFLEKESAEATVRDLWAAGFAQDRIDMVSPDQGQTMATPHLDRDRDAARGAVAGTLTGASTGALAGAIATLLIPGIGTIIGGGLLAGVLGGAALGAAGGSFVGPFVALKMDENHARQVAAEVERGQIAVVVLAFDRVNEARAILLKNGGRLVPFNTAAFENPIAVPGRA
jgi:hypothetical protein